MGHYAPKTFLRQIPAPLLREFFGLRDLLAGLDWSALHDGDIDPIYEAWQALPDGPREMAEVAFRGIHDLACEDGIKVIVDEALFHGTDLAGELSGCDGLHHKVMWTFLHHAEVFKAAARFFHAERLSTRYWTRRENLPRVTPDVSRETCAELERSLSAFYRDEQGRGQRCTVEPYLRQGRQYYFFAYPDDYTQTALSHGPDKRLRRRPQRPVFEVIFVFEPGAGTLEMYAPGDRFLRRSLAEMFCRVVLGTELPEEPRRPVYELDGLKRRDCALPTDPGDGIEQVRLRRLRLSFSGQPGRTLTLQVDPQGQPEDVYDMMDEVLDEKRHPRSGFHVTQATFQFRLAPADEDGRPKTVTFDVTYPNSSNLKSLRDEHRQLGEKYLQRWGIVGAG